MSSLLFLLVAEAKAQKHLQMQVLWGHQIIELFGQNKTPIFTIGFSPEFTFSMAF